jgi:hypothetical protein
LTVRRRLALLLTATTLAVGGSVLTAGAAEARRNVGGTVPADAICLSPGHSQARSDRADDVLSCFCWIAPAPGERNVGGTVPGGTTNCPPGILKQMQRPDRNVGG